ncbi:MAG: BlaI/MecI/CopY family transcriptional regulator [Myxococcota bacterium]
MPLLLEPLGDLEHLLMEAVWSGGAGTVRDVCDRLPAEEARAYTTVMTTLDRLHRKGLLHREKAGLAWRYVPTLDRAAWEKALADALASRILAEHGDVGLAAFVDAAADDAMLDRLAELVEARRRR